MAFFAAETRAGGGAAGRLSRFCTDPIDSHPDPRILGPQTRPGRAGRRPAAAGLRGEPRADGSAGAGILRERARYPGRERFRARAAHPGPLRRLERGCPSAEAEGLQGDRPLLAGDRRPQPTLDGHPRRLRRVVGGPRGDRPGHRLGDLRRPAAAVHREYRSRRCGPDPAGPRRRRDPPTRTRPRRPPGTPCAATWPSASCSASVSPRSLPISRA